MPLNIGKQIWVLSDKVNKFTLYSNYSAHISSNESHFWRLGSWYTEHVRSVNLGMVWKSESLLCTLNMLHCTNSSFMGAFFKEYLVLVNFDNTWIHPVSNQICRNFDVLTSQICNSTTNSMPETTKKPGHEFYWKYNPVFFDNRQSYYVSNHRGS